MMHIYNRVIVEHIGHLFFICLGVISLLMLMILSVDQLSTLPDNIAMYYIMEYVMLECVHIACWVFPIALYVAMVLWAMMATENQLIYRLFHAGWSRIGMYGAMSLWIVPVCILSIVLNFYYLPIARVAQKILLQNIYQHDVSVYLENNRFHKLSLGDEKWVIYFSRVQKKNKIYAFKKYPNRDFSVMYAPSTHTNADKGELELEGGVRVDFKAQARWPIEIWKFAQYALYLSPPQLIHDNEQANYSIKVWDTPDMDHVLEYYNRMGRVLMLVILSFVPLLLVEGVSIRKRLFIVHQALAWYAIYWMLFILCRWFLMWDNFTHINLIFVPHIIMVLLILIYYWFFVRRI